MRMSLFIFLIFFMKRFDHHKKMFNNGFPIVFLKSDLGVGGRFCLSLSYLSHYDPNGFPGHSLNLLVFVCSPQTLTFGQQQLQTC